MEKSVSSPTYVAPAGEVTDAFGFSIQWADPRDHSFINDLAGIEATSIDNEKEGISWKYRPYPISRFGAVINYLIDNVAIGQDFLEVGCGVGTKLALVAKLFGLYPLGIDVVPEYLTASRDLLEHYQLVGTVLNCDAQAFAYYDSYNIIFCNSPLWSWEDERALEQKILDEAMPGAVLMLGNSKVEVPQSWVKLTAEIALDVYQKPGG